MSFTFRSRCRALTRFLRDLLRWFEGGYDQMSPQELEKERLFFLWSGDILEEADAPLAAIRAYLAQMEEQEAEAGHGRNRASEN